MRLFRLIQRNGKTNDITKQRDYNGLEELLKWGEEPWRRATIIVSSKLIWDETRYREEPCEPYTQFYGELYEMINNKWVILPKSEILEIFNANKGSLSSSKTELSRIIVAGFK